MAHDHPLHFAAPYPFVRETYAPPDPEEAERPTWRPGVRHEYVAPDDADLVADGMGRILLTVVSTHKPGRYPERVFFTRQWRDPDGHVFGKPRLHIATAEKFRRLARGYAHDFRLAGDPPTTSARRQRLWDADAVFLDALAERVAQVGECCGGDDALCAGGCLVDIALKRIAALAAASTKVEG